MTLFSMIRRVGLSVLALCLLAGPPAMAQSLFAPVAKVNERVITAYELDQRARMMTLFRTPGDVREAALKALVDERLQLEVARRAGVSVDADAVSAGMEEFAQRANLGREEFIKALGQAGVEPETFRDFVAAGVAWRQIVRARFGGPRTTITDAEIDRAIDQQDLAPGLRVLLNEIILPADTPAAAARARERAAEISQITTLPAFAQAARSFSRSATRNVGGRLNWVPIGNLPPAVAAQVSGLSPGQVTAPIPVPDAIALFQLRAREEIEAPTPQARALDYAALYLPGGRSDATLAEAARIAGRVDTCDDLYGIARNMPANALERSAVPAGDIPGDVALELAKLDENEVSTGLTRGDALVFLMLCDRRPVVSEEAPVNRDGIRAQLLNQRLAAKAGAYLADLRANATITYN